MRVILIFLLFAIVFGSGCATPRYVLATREKPGFFHRTEESAPIANESGVALLYDRARWVVIERESKDGSASVHYAVTIKNGSDKGIKAALDKIAIQSQGGATTPAIFAPEDRKTASQVIAPGSMLRVTSRFQLQAALIHEAASSSNPLELTVPLESGVVLKQKVWLWKE